jgi:hypothetical protein
LRACQVASVADSARVSHLVRHGMNPGDNPYHVVLVHVNGDDTWLEVIGVDWAAASSRTGARVPGSVPACRRARR